MNDPLAELELYGIANGDSIVRGKGGSMTDAMQTTTFVDYRDLLRRYILHVRECEGTDFLPISDHTGGFGMASNVPFSNGEAIVLDALSRSPID